MNLPNNLITQFFKGKSRTAKAKRHIMYSLVIQGISVIISLLYVPLLLDYLTQEKYGIWLTLTSILGWFSFFDIGMGNGLRNKLTTAIAKENFDLGRKYVSTTYALITLIFVVILIVFHLINRFLDWNSILNTDTIGSNELYILTSIVFTFFIIRFIVQLISNVYLADQKPSVAKMMATGGTIFSFLAVLIVREVTFKGDLILLGAIITVIPVLVYLLVSFYSFNNLYRNLKPSRDSVNFKLSKSLLNLGSKFFFLQVSYIIVFSTSNIFITHFYGPAEVAVYNIAYKYFQVPVMVFSIILSPIWSAVTDAYTKSEFKWLKRTLKQLNFLSLIFIVLIIVMILISNWVYKKWVGDDIVIPYSLSISIGIYTILQIIVSPYSSFINGIGKLKLTLSLTFVGITTYLVLIYVFGNIFKNSTGIVLAIICTRLIGAVIQPIQVNRLLNNKARGIWNK